MTLREKLNEQFNTALKSKNKTSVSTFRLILAAIKEREIANRSGGKKEEIKDPEIIKVLRYSLAGDQGQLDRLLPQ